jgi:hypothetical protein
MFIDLEQNLENRAICDNFYVSGSMMKTNQSPVSNNPREIVNLEDDQGGIKASSEKENTKSSKLIKNLYHKPSKSGDIKYVSMIEMHDDDVPPETPKNPVASSNSVVHSAHAKMKKKNRIIKRLRKENEEYVVLNRHMKTENEQLKVHSSKLQ